MNENSDTAEVLDQEAAENPPSDSQKKPDPDTSNNARRRSRFWPALTLVLILGSAAAAGWGWLQYQGLSQQSTDMAQFSQRLNETEQTLAALEDLEQRLLQIEEGLLERNQAASQELAAIEQQIAGMTASLESMTGQDGSARRQWLLSEAAYYLRVANAQMALAGDANTAIRALGMADDKLRQAGDPRLTPVRRAVSDEIASLQGLPRADVEGVVLRLDALSRRIEQLPLRQQVPDSFDARDPAADSGSTGLARAWESIKRAFSSLVRIRPSEVAPEALASPSQELLLFRGLEAEISIAKLAYLQSEGDVFRAAINETLRRVRVHFDTDGADVQAALTALEEIGESQTVAARPDISGSLGLLLELDPGAAAP